MNANDCMMISNALAEQLMKTLNEKCCKDGSRWWESAVVGVSGGGSQRWWESAVVGVSGGGSQRWWESAVVGVSGGGSQRWWESAMGVRTASIDLSHSSRHACQTFNRLTGPVKKAPPCPANTIASRLIDNHHHQHRNKQISEEVNTEITNRRKSEDHGNGYFSGAFTETEKLMALKRIKSGKAQGPDP